MIFWLANRTYSIQLLVKVYNTHNMKFKIVAIPFCLSILLHAWYHFLNFASLICFIKVGSIWSFNFNNFLVFGPVASRRLRNAELEDQQVAPPTKSLFWRQTYERLFRNFKDRHVKMRWDRTGLHLLHISFVLTKVFLL